MIPFEYLVAENPDAALKATSKRGVMLKAGGVDVLDMLKEHLAEPKVVVSIDGIEELRYVRQEQDGVHIGCGTTLAEIGRSELMEKSFPVLHTAAAHAATPQIRERATIGGNLCQRPRCWYFRNSEFPCLKKRGHTCYSVEGEHRYHAIFGGGPCYIVHPSNVAPALLAIDAQLVIRSSKGEEEAMPATEFFRLPEESLYAENVLRPGEMITEVILPHAPTHSATIELREKQSFDWPLVMCSVARIDNAWRVCLGAVAPIPWLSEPAMDVLGDSPITPELATAAAEAAVEDAESMGDNEYKITLAKVAIKRALLAAAAQGGT